MLLAKLGYFLNGHFISKIPKGDLINRWLIGP